MSTEAGSTLQLVETEHIEITVQSSDDDSVFGDENESKSSVKTILNNAFDIGVGRGGGQGGPGPPNNLRGGGQHTLWPPPILHPPVPAKLFLSILSLNFL